MSRLSLSMNTSNAAVGQPGNLPFVSYVVIGGKLYGSSPNGIFLMEGDTDNGTEILAFFKTFSSGLKTAFKKRVRTIFVSGNTKGDLSITPVNDNDEGGQYLVSPLGTTYFRGHRVAINRDERGFYIGVKVANVDGADFCINDISILVSDISQR